MDHLIAKLLKLQIHKRHNFWHYFILLIIFGKVDFYAAKINFLKLFILPLKE
jgi:hypothetical protein